MLGEGTRLLMMHPTMAAERLVKGVVPCCTEIPEDVLEEKFDENLENFQLCIFMNSFSLFWMTNKSISLRGISVEV